MQKALLLSWDELLTFCLYDICAPVRSTEMQTMLFLTFDLYIFQTTFTASKQILLLWTRYVEHRPLLFIRFTYSSLQMFAHRHNPSSDICILVRWVRYTMCCVVNGMDHLMVGSGCTVTQMFYLIILLYRHYINKNKKETADPRRTGIAGLALPKLSIGLALLASLKC